MNKRIITGLVGVNRQQVGLLSTGDYYNVNPIRQAVFGSVLKFSH